MINTHIQQRIQKQIFFQMKIAHNNNRDPISTDIKIPFLSVNKIGSKFSSAFFISLQPSNANKKKPKEQIERRNLIVYLSFKKLYRILIKIIRKDEKIRK